MKRKLLFTVFLSITFSLHAAKYTASTADTSIPIVEVLPPSITSQPQGGTIYVGESIDVSITATDYTTIQWEFSIDNGSSWGNATDGGTFSGSTTTTLTFTPDIQITSGLLFRAIVTDASNDTVTSSEALVIVSNYTQVPDPNFEARLEALGYDDISGDGQVPTSLIRNVTNLNINAQNISDLTGIEAFTALTELRADNNNVSYVDFSSNTAITRIFMRNNNMTTLDLTANTGMRRLLVENNGMTDLNITGLAVLDALFAANNNLTSLDLSSNPNIGILGLGNNNLSSLNMRNGGNTRITIWQTVNNPNLYCIEVDDVAYANANFTNKDAQTGFSEVDCYVPIPDANFEAALDALGYDDISGDGRVPVSLIETVTSLSIGSTGISDLTGIASFTALETLLANNNTISTADLSSNANLVTVSLRNNGLTSLDVSGSPNLGLILVENNNLTSIDVTNNPLLTRLWAQNNSLNALDVSNNTILTAIGATNSNLSSIDVSNIPTLEQLYVEGNNLTELDLSNNPALVIVGASSNNLSSFNMQNGNNVNVTNFTAGNNPNLTCITVDDAAYSTTNWTNIDAQTSFSETAYCVYTQIPDTNFEAALETLGFDDVSADGQVPTELIEVVDSLNVSSQGIADLTGIEDFTSLEELIIYDNSISSVNTDNLTQLQELSASLNTISSLDFTNNVLLETVRVDSNSLTSLVPTALANLKILDISGNSISSINLSNNTVLEEFYANDNQLASIDLTANTALLNILLDNNSLTDATLKNGNNTNIVSFSITGNSNLDCVFVDDVAYATANFTNIDPQMVFRDGDYCEYTAIPDANFETAIFNEGLDDVLGDGQVPTTLIESVTNFNANGNNISDLTGIEAFTNLRSLSLRANNLTTVDFTSNTLLIFLDLDENTISNIDLTGLTALRNLDLEDNSLTSLDLSTNINLEQLMLSSNANLGSLNVANNTDLTILEVNFCTNLTTITFGNNFLLFRVEATQAGLTSLDVRTLVRLRQIYLDDTFIPSLELWNNTLLRDVYIQNTPISYLDLRNGNNTDIDDFFLQNNPNLFCILVDDAAYSTTNWTNVDAQANFSDTFCLYTPIPDSNFEAALDAIGLDDISGDGQVPTVLIGAATAINIASQNISDLTGIEVFAALETLIANNNTITSVDFSNNANLTQINLEGNAIATIDLTANTDLEILNLNNSVFSTIDLSANTLLREISITSNTNLTTIDVTANTNLENLILSDSGLTDIALGNLTSLEIFDVANNTLESLDLSALSGLAQVNVSNNNLSFLDVRNGNNIGIGSFNATGNPNLLCISVDNTSNAVVFLFIVDPQTGFSTTDYCSYTTIPDANFEAELENLGLDDISGDGQVPTVLIEAVTSLDITGLNIADLTGIKDFTSLQTLNVSATALLTLDISDMTSLETFVANPAPFFLGAFDASNCTALQSLTLVDTAITQIDITGATSLEELNVYTTSLSSLDVSTNTALEVINAYQTGLTTVDVSNLTLLREFRGYNSTISALDFTNNPALEIVDVSNTSLTSLNIRNGNNTNITSFNATSNPSLTCIFVDDAAYSTTNWTNIDATASFTSTNYCRYTAIPDPNFEIILGNLSYDDIPNDGQVPTELIEVVTSLNLAFLNISDITGIQDFAALQTLIAINTNVMNVDLSGMPNLETLNIASTAALNSLDVSSTPALKTINASNSNVSSIDLADAIALEELYLSGTQIMTLDVNTNMVLKRLEAGNTPLMNVNFGGVNTIEVLSLNDTDITLLNTTGFPALRELQLQNNPMLVGDLDLSLNTNLEILNISSTEISYVDFRNGNNTIITAFDATVTPALTCILVDDATYSTANWPNIDTNSNFSDTFCRYTQIPDSNFETVLFVLGYDDIFQDGQVPTALIEVVTSLSTGAENIADLTGIEDFVALRTLSVGGNTFTTLDLSANTLLEDFRCTAGNLESVNVSNCLNLKIFFVNQIPLTTVDFSNNTELEELLIVSGNLTSIDLTNNIKLKDLTIRENPIGTIDLSTLVDLESLSLVDCGLTAIDITNNTILEGVSLNDNSISSIDLSNSSSLVGFGMLRNQLSAIDFTNTALIETINITGNNLTTLTIPALTELRTVNVDDNTNLSSLTFENLPSLEIFSAENCAIATIENLSNLTALEELFLSQNQLETLDISQNSAVRRLEVNTNNLSFLNVKNANNTSITNNNFDARNNANLTCILVDDAAYSTTTWNNIDAQTSFSDTFCRYTAIPDANFEDILDILGYDDIPADGQVPTALIEVVTSLNVSGRSISDLTGIEDFAALIDLNIGGNQIVNLDLSANVLLEEFRSFRGSLETVNTSNCVNLRVFAAAQNAITTLDLSDNIALEEFSVTNNNLSSLDVTNNTNLTILEASSNQIGNIDVSNNTLLDRIALGSCGLTSIDVSNNVNLTFLSLGSNDISMIDLSNNPLLDYIFMANGALTAIDFSNNLLLEYISLRDNNLTTLAIPDLPNLTDLLIDENPNLSSLTLGALPVLDELNASECALTTIDMSQMPAIIRLDLADNQFTSLDVSANTALNRVYVENNDLNFLNVRNGNNINFLDFDATNNPNLTCIFVDDAAYSTANWPAIDATASFTSTDYCDYTAIPDSIFETMLGNLGLDDVSGDGQVPTELIENITVLDISYNFAPINDLTGIEAFTALEELDFDGHSVNTVDLSANTNLRVLSCEANGLTALDLTGLSQLEVLEAGANSFNSLDFSAVPNLTKLLVYSTQITDLDVSQLTALTFLDCGFNTLSTLNVQNGNNTNFTYFDASGNFGDLTCIQVDDVAYSTANWTNIDAGVNFSTTPYCRYTQIPDANFEATLDALGLDDITADGQVPTALIETRVALEIENSNITDLTGIEDFAALLVLDIEGNNIASLDISNNTNLLNLIATGNNFTTLDLSANTVLELLIIDQAISLTTLDVSNNPALTFFDANGCTNLATITFGANGDVNYIDLKDTAISALDISSATNVRYLDITRTNVTNIDLTSNIALEVLLAEESALETIDIRSGTNTIITQFNTLNSPNLTCISVDNVAYSTTNWTNVDATVNFTATDYCRYTAIPDTVFESRLEALGLDDISGDGQVPTALIEVVTTLDASFLFTAITDLTGIQDFTALENLNVTGNDLTTLDLTSNTNLKIVYCDANELNTINLIGLTELEELNVGDNPFTSLDISTNTKLTRLSIYDAQITALDVSHLTFLTSLDCSFGSLTALNVRNGNNINFTSFDASFNPNLTCILVDDAAYSTANWDNIDATASFTSTDYCRYTQIPDANFEAALDALGYDDIPGDGQVPTELIEVVTELNVASNNISDMTGIQDFAALELFYPFNNNLTNLDVSQNTNLQILLVSDNNLMSLDLSNNVALTFLNANNNAISAIDLSANINLLSLRINNNALTSLDVSANPSLARVTCENNLLTNLDLSGNSLLTTIQVAGNNLISLNVQNGNNFNVITFSALNNPSLTCITVDDVAYSDISWTDIDPQTVFTTDDCRYTLIPDANFEAALEALGYDDISGDGRVPTGLIEVVNTLNVSNQSIADLTGIQDFTALQVLNIENNSIVDLDISDMPNLLVLEAPNAITSSLDASNTPLLEEVNIQESDIATINLSGATSLTILLAFRTNISTLDLSTNNSLTVLVAFEMPNLTNVDLTGAVLLSNLEIYQTPLETLDLTSNISLQFVTLFQNNLMSLDIRNGNNTNITSFSATSNPNLTCIFVDDAAYSTTNWTNIDATAGFSDTYCRYTQIPDTAFETFLGNVGWDDIAGDGQVPTALIENATGMSIIGFPIADLTGIEDFAALNNFTIAGANLTDVDFSQNTALTRLNLVASGITSLDVSACTALDFLNISGSSMTSVDLSNNPVLNYLAFSDDTITELDLSQNTVLTISLFGDLPNLTSLNLQNGNNTNVTQFSISSAPNLDCVLVDDAAYSTANWTAAPSNISYNEVSCDNVFDINIKVYLQGAALNPNTGEENLMRDDLRVSGFIPTRSPYADMLNCEPSVFDVTGDNAIVDWIWVELREASNNTTVAYSRSALLQRDGDVVDVDGVSPLNFTTEENSYRIAVKHRSHLGIITNSAITFGADNTIDFTANGTGVYGVNSRTSSGMPSGVLGLWCGNVNSDTVVQYSGTSPDTPEILSEVLNDPGNFLNFPTYSITGYNVTDANMDGMIQYSGTNPDTPFILQNVLAHPGNFLGFSTYQIIEQLPENLLN